MSDITTTTTKSHTISAVVICHKDKVQLLEFLGSLKKQSEPPEEVIVCVCCMDLDGIEGDIILKSPHKEDWGAEKCDQGLKLASSDYIWYANADDEPDTRFLELLGAEDADIIACDFSSHIAGEYVKVAPVIGAITRGTFIVRRELAQSLGYKDRSYEADGVHARDMADHGTFKRVEELLYRHN